MIKVSDWNPPKEEGNPKRLKINKKNREFFPCLKEKRKRKKILLLRCFEDGGEKPADNNVALIKRTNAT